MQTIDTASGTAVETGNDRIDGPYTPREFLRELGSVMAVCLGLALLAHVLVAFVGSN
ncbi:MAG TPA: hypothetical protein VFL55_23850 [Acetobacteraceae bacterium]|nr:hypothetical protein [Acetobacteraceae bacterium]